MVDPLSYFSFQPLLHDWGNKYRGMCYPVYGMMHIKEGTKEVFYLTTHSTHFIYGFMASDHSDSGRGNPLPPHGLSFSINSKGYFICTIPQTG